MAYSSEQKRQARWCHQGQWALISTINNILPAPPWRHRGFFQPFTSARSPATTNSSWIRFHRRLSTKSSTTFRIPASAPLLSLRKGGGRGANNMPSAESGLVPNPWWTVGTQKFRATRVGSHPTHSSPGSHGLPNGGILRSSAVFLRTSAR